MNIENDIVNEEKTLIEIKKNQVYAWTGESGHIWFFNNTKKDLAKMLEKSSDQVKTITSYIEKNLELKHANVDVNESIEVSVRKFSDAKKFKYSDLANKFDSRSEMAKWLQVFVDFRKDIDARVKLNRANQYGANNFLGRAVNDDSGFNGNAIKFSSILSEFKYSYNKFDDELTQNFGLFDGVMMMKTINFKKEADWVSIYIDPKTGTYMLHTLEGNTYEELKSIIIGILSKAIPAIDNIIDEYKVLSMNIDSENQSPEMTVDDLIEKILEVFPFMLLRKSTLKFFYNNNSDGGKTLQTIKLVDDRGNQWGVARVLEVIGESLRDVKKNSISISNTDKSAMYYINQDLYPPVETHDPFITGFIRDRISHPLGAMYLFGYLWKLTFAKKSSGRQLLYLTNKGQGGTSTIIEAFSKLLYPKFTASISDEVLSEPARQCAIVGKRLVTHKDATNVNKLLETQFYKGMVDGEQLQLRPLYAKPFDYDPYNDLIISSNKKLYVNTQYVKSRVLPVPFNEVTKTSVHGKAWWVEQFLNRKDEMLKHAHYCYEWLKSRNLTVFGSDFVIAYCEDFEKLKKEGITDEQRDILQRTFAGWQNIHDNIIPGRVDDYSDLKDLSFANDWKVITDAGIDLNEIKPGSDRQGLVITMILEKHFNDLSQTRLKSYYEFGCGKVKMNAELMDFSKWIYDNACVAGRTSTRINGKTVNIKKWKVIHSTGNTWLDQHPEEESSETYINDDTDFFNSIEED